jgi:phage shock protein A
MTMATEKNVKEMTEIELRGEVTSLRDVINDLGKQLKKMESDIASLKQEKEAAERRAAKAEAEMYVLWREEREKLLASAYTSCSSDYLCRFGGVPLN